MSKYLIVVGLLMIVIVSCLAEERLQIGIKKKAEKCDVKSKKGDRLHMHYTVSYSQIFQCLLVSKSIFVI